jgi:hypothetical protein
MTALLSIFPVYRKGSPWQPVLCLWFRPHKTLVATSCDENRKSLKLQQKPLFAFFGHTLSVVSKTKQTSKQQHKCAYDCDQSVRGVEDVSVYFSITSNNRSAGAVMT